VLPLHAHDVVTSEQLIADLWGGDAPASSVQLYVSQIRPAGGPCSASACVLGIPNSARQGE
jgi:hypothetical protein